MSKAMLARKAEVLPAAHATDAKMRVADRICWFLREFKKKIKKIRKQSRPITQSRRLTTMCAWSPANAPQQSSTTGLKRTHIVERLFSRHFPVDQARATLADATTHGGANT